MCASQTAIWHWTQIRITPHYTHFMLCIVFVRERLLVLRVLKIFISCNLFFFLPIKNSHFTLCRNGINIQSVLPFKEYKEVFSFLSIHLQFSEAIFGSNFCRFKESQAEVFSRDTDLSEIFYNNGVSFCRNIVLITLKWAVKFFAAHFMHKRFWKMRYEPL